MKISSNKIQFKLTKRFPSIECPELGHIKVFEIGRNNNSILYHREWSEFWEELKEPLFVTYDGVELFDEQDIVYGIGRECESTFQLELYNNLNQEDFIWFSSSKLRDKWMEENKLVFSKLKIKEALDKTIYSFLDNNLAYKLGSCPATRTAIEIDKFRNLLGL